MGLSLRRSMFCGFRTRRFRICERKLEIFACGGSFVVDFLDFGPISWQKCPFLTQSISKTGPHYSEKCMYWGFWRRGIQICYLQSEISTFTGTFVVDFPLFWVKKSFRYRYLNSVSEYFRSNGIFRSWRGQLIGELYKDPAGSIYGGSFVFNFHHFLSSKKFPKSR